jgi:hypothetical protein
MVPQVVLFLSRLEDVVSPRPMAIISVLLKKKATLFFQPPLDDTIEDMISVISLSHFAMVVGTESGTRAGSPTLKSCSTAPQKCAVCLSSSLLRPLNNAVRTVALARFSDGPNTT